MILGKMCNKVIVCFPSFIICQRDCLGMSHEQGFSMDVYALYKLTIITIINQLLGLKSINYGINHQQ